jgi:L-threonylcarbamoyladenylate synthase
MNTEYINISEDPQTAFEKAKKYLDNSEPIIFPTETVYGLGCKMSDLEAVKKIYKIKERDAKKPLAAHISNLEQVKELVEEIPPLFYDLAEKYLPGPLAIIMKKKATVSDEITSGFDTISIRFPDNQECLDLIDYIGEPLAATSANISGEPAVLSGTHAFEKMNHKVGLILDGGLTKYEKESTVISIIKGEIQILRQGILSIENY